MGIYQTRIRVVRLIREFFWSRGFVETDTPLAVRYPGQEPYLHPIPVTLHDPRGEGHPFYLHTSPEFSMKKLLAAGFEKIFQITKTFRDHESFGGKHNPEFTMIEWYRAPGTYRDIMEDVEALFKFISNRLHADGLIFKNKRYKIQDSWERMSMREVWQKYAGVELNEFLEFTPKAGPPLAEGKLADLVRSRGYQVGQNDTYDDLFFKIFLNEIEPHLGAERPLFVYDYPAQMASLSRLCEHDPRYAERVECYIGGLELCNGFGELLDADEQKQRLEKDRALRQKLGKETWPVDPDFIAALRSGIASPTSGIALGVDRVVVLFTGAKDINEVIFGSVADQLEGD